VIAQKLGAGGCGKSSTATSILIVLSVLALSISGSAVAFAAPEQPAAPRQPAAAQPRDQDTSERVKVEGFRSAHWGMTEAQVKAAIHKDFNIPAEKQQAEENPSERTTVLTVTVNDLLEGAGKARISYIFGYSTKKLIEVNIVWGNTIDPQAKPERIVAAANQLRTLFLSSGYDSQTVASNVATADGSITVFQGQDTDKHMTLLRLVSTPAPASAKQHGKTEAAHPTVVLFLSYLLDARNPDVYRLKKGLF
jgi:ABC-type dipeptide/oligopeptide/nickel transport system ATPase component